MALQFAAILSFGATSCRQIAVRQPIPQIATIEANAAAAGSQKIPRTIFGTFLEPIGNSSYNGLWAELPQNPSLEAGLWSPVRIAEMFNDTPELRKASDLALPLQWEPLDVHQGNRYEVHYGDAANSWQSLQIFGVPGAFTGIKQRVCLHVHRTCDYVGSFYARHVSGDASINISLRIRDQNEVLASQQIQVAAGNGPTSLSNRLFGFTTFFIPTALPTAKGRLR